jgi:pimeloyl-ACP methyl ester carboxylesterase
MADEGRYREVAVDGGRIEAYTMAGGSGVPLVVLGGVETGLRPLKGTESVLLRRWAGRRERREVTVIGRPLPDDPSDAGRVMHPRRIADGVAVALDELGLEVPVAIEAESGGVRISLWLTVDHPDLVGRLVLASGASETPPDSPMAERLGKWLAIAEAGDWGRLFSGLAAQMRPEAGGSAEAFDTAARLQPRPATPERFIGELRTTLDPTSWVTDRLAEIRVPTLVLAGGQDQVVPPDISRILAERIPGAGFEIDPQCGHTVRSAFRGYDQLVETFLAKGDPT